MSSVAFPYVSGATAAVLILLQMLLTLAVVLQRRRNRQSLGDGDNPALLRAIRRHGNFAENAALFIAGFTLYELLGGPVFTLEILCAVFVAARLSHVIGLSVPNTSNIFRVAGIAGTVGVGLVLSARLLLLVGPHISLPGQ